MTQCAFSDSDEFFIAKSDTSTVCTTSVKNKMIRINLI